MSKDLQPKAATAANNVRLLREDLLMSKAELSRRSGLSPLTIHRVESGMSCRMETKRKIILALGLKLSDKRRVFGADEPEAKEGSETVQANAGARAEVRSGGRD